MIRDLLEIYAELFIIAVFFAAPVVTIAILLVRALLGVHCG